jgi:protein SCO1/2
MMRVLLTILLGVLCLLTACRSSREELPRYGDVPAFSFTSQEGRPVSAESLRGKTWVAAFMFTRCPSICPALTRAMKGVQDDAKARGVPLTLVRFSVDPANDTPEVLARYAVEHDADLSTWSFLTGDFSAMRRTSEDGFKLAVAGGADPGGDHFGITHGSHLVLVDPTLSIRGYYRSSEPEALTRLVDDAARLAK